MNTVSSDKTRIRALDVLRGLTVLSMVAFHTAYDLAYIFELPVPWFTSRPVQDIWRNSISWTFLFLAGWMCAYSRNNVKRAIRYGAFAHGYWIKAHQDQYPTILKTITSKPIEWIGRHSLLIYALHQPLTLLILQIVISQ